jgi:hypothetical protein
VPFVVTDRGETVTLLPDTLTSTLSYSATSIPVPFSVMVLVPAGMIYWLGIGATVTGPVVYFPAATAVCWDVLGVIVVAA